MFVYMRGRWKQQLPRAVQAGLQLYGLVCAHVLLCVLMCCCCRVCSLLCSCAVCCRAELWPQYPDPAPVAPSLLAYKNKVDDFVSTGTAGKCRVLRCTVLRWPLMKSPREML